MISKLCNLINSLLISLITTSLIVVQNSVIGSHIRFQNNILFLFCLLNTSLTVTKFSFKKILTSSRNYCRLQANEIIKYNTMCL